MSPMQIAGAVDAHWERQQIAEEARQQRLADLADEQTAIVEELMKNAEKLYDAFGDMGDVAALEMFGHIAALISPASDHDAQFAARDALRELFALYLMPYAERATALLAK